MICSPLYFHFEISMNLHPIIFDILLPPIHDMFLWILLENFLVRPRRGPMILETLGSFGRLCAKSGNRAGKLGIRNWGVTVRLVIFVSAFIGGVDREYSILKRLDIL